MTNSRTLKRKENLKLNKTKGNGVDTFKKKTD